MGEVEGIARRQDPLDEGWHAKSVVPPDLTRPTSGPHEPICYPACHYKPEHLVYDRRWVATPLAGMAAALEGLMPDELRPAWRDLCAGAQGTAGETGA